MSISYDTYALSKNYTDLVSGGGGGGSDGIKRINFNGTAYTPDSSGKVTINEADPTVPAWAKSETKPSYTAEEIQAVDVDDTFTFEELDAMFDTVFG